MKAGTKRHSATKCSGSELLGEVPEHWQIRRLGHIGDFSKGRGGNKRDEVGVGIPCVRYGDLYTRHQFFITESKACVVPHRARAYTPIRYGDVLFAGSGETLEEIGKSAVNLISRSAVCGGDVIIFRPTINLDAKFIGWSTDCRHAASQKARMGRGITVMHIYASELKKLVVSLPPLLEQTAIVRFLDHAERRIRRCVRAKERLIELLEEERQAVIHEAVTGQIDVRTGQPYPVYKDSRVEWLGEVPEHWEVAALRYRYEQCLGKMLDTQRITGEFLMPYLRNVDVQWDDINVRDLPTMDIHPDEVERYSVRPGDLLVCEGGEVGRCAVWQGEADRCGFQKALHRLRPRNANFDIPRFLYYVLRVAVGREAFADGHESTITHLTGEKLRAHRFAFPPLAEQQAIQVFLDTTCRQIEAASDAQRSTIQLLREYRTRLVADAVTGKIDVREAAASLPEIDPLDVQGGRRESEANTAVSPQATDTALISASP